MPEARVIRIPFNVLPAEEHEVGQKIDNALVSFDWIISQFEAALRLLDFCESERSRLRMARDNGLAVPNYHETRSLLASWAQLAGRNGALTLGDFAETLHKLRARLKRCPTLASMVVGRDLEAAIQMFHRLLPRTGDIRDASAHPTETGVNSFDGGYDKHRIKVAEEATGTTLTGRSGRTFYVTVKGTVLEYDLSQETLEKLLAVRRSVYSVFSPASDHLMEMVIQRRTYMAGDGE
jgi:hypothetical protein